MTNIQPVVARSRSEPQPLSASQSAVWQLCQVAPQATVCHELVTMRKSGPLDLKALRRALSDVVARHDVFRSTFVTIDGVPHQVVWESVDVELPLVDVSHLNVGDAARRSTEIAVADTQRPYDLAEGPLIRPLLVRVNDDDHRLHFGLHALIFDEATLRRVLFPELTALYRAHQVKTSSSLPAPRAQYAQYAASEVDRVREPETAGRIARWRSRLAGSTPSQLPADHPRPPIRTFTGGAVPVALDHATVEGLRRTARVAGGTLVDALAAAHAWWLHLYTDSTDVVFGSVQDLRGRDDLQAVAGNCETPVVLRCGVSGDEPFTALVDRTRRVVAEALADVVPYDTLLAGLGESRDLLNNNLFQSSLRLRSPVTAADDDGWTLQAADVDVRDAVGSARFDIGFELEEQADGQLAGGMIFSADVFDRESARAMASHWCSLLNAVATKPDMPMAEHDLVTAEERARQLSWNRSCAVDLSPQCVHEVIDSQIAHTPDAVAVQAGDATMTFRQLSERAAAISSHLVQRGAGPGTVVALLLERTPDVVAAMLGVLRSGAAFLPLDSRQPAARNAFSINDVGASIVLTDCTPPAGEDPIAAVVVDLDDVGPDDSGRRLLSNTVSVADLAYVICTSGSTGQPKPVLIEHRGATNLIRTLSREFGVGVGDTVLSVASISFDMAVFDIFYALASGARVVLANVSDVVNPASLNELIAETGATYMMATPTTWRALLAAGWRGDRRLRAASGGETLVDGLAEELLQRCGAVWNGYGPTETTAGTSVARLAIGDTVTVGRPLPNLRVYITDTRGRLQPIGVPGEIVIGGVGVGRGYLNRPEEQARRFGDDPFHVGGRIYRTGDRGRFLADGRIQHLGRYDDQLKVRGFRVEPGEIESILCGHPDVGACAVVARELPSGEQQLVAYVVGEPARLNGAEIREWLRRRLPEYMVPGAVVHLCALPMTTNGKLDKTALPAPPPPGRPGAQSPRSDMERRVAALWTELLGMPVTDIDSDFFDMGGHSLSAAQLISAAELAFGVKLSFDSFVDEGRSVATFARLLSAESESRNHNVDPARPVHFIFSDAASAMSLRHFTAQWGDRQPVHALVPDQPGGLFDRSVTIEEHARQALSAIRERQPDGPLVLVGYSIGGLIAYEVARQALDGGQQIDWLGIIDAVAPPLHEQKRAELTLLWRLRALRRRSARERLAKSAEVALRVLRRPSPWRQREFDHHGAAHIACRYQRPAHGVLMELYSSEDLRESAGHQLLGWNEFHNGPVADHRFAGDHTSLLRLPQAKLLAEIMLESFDKSGESTCGALIALPRNYAGAGYHQSGADTAMAIPAKHA